MVHEGPAAGQLDLGVRRTPPGKMGNCVDRVSYRCASGSRNAQGRALDILFHNSVGYSSISHLIRS